MKLFGNSEMTDAEIRRITKDDSIGNIPKAMDKSLERINSILSRKDVINIENEKLDAIRLLAYYLEDKEMTAAQLVKFLKG
jgi:hypothetical protein